MLKNRVAGVVATISQYTQSGQDFQMLIDAHVPLIFFDRSCPDVAADRVVVDFYDGAYQLTNFLLKKGYKRIAHISGPQQIEGARARLDGYRDSLLHHNITIADSLIVNGGFLAEDGMRAAKELLECDKKPDAIFAVNDDVAIGAMVTLKKRGIRIPDDIGLVGFDNDKMSPFTYPALTTVDIQRDMAGHKAIRLLLKNIVKNKSDYDYQVEKIKTKIIHRESA